MSSIKRITGVIALALYFCSVSAQNKKYEYITDQKDTLFHDVRIYGGLTHQHQDFFHKAFSFQGIEAGVVINHTMLAGTFGSLFVSNLDVKSTNYAHLFINIKEAGLFLGKMNNEMKLIHTGWLLNVGYFSLEGDEADFALFHSQNPLIQINGLVLSPQIFAEMNIARWMKLRTGLSYSFYSFEDQSIIKKSDMNNIALTFGFIVGKFN